MSISISEDKDVNDIKDIIKDDIFECEFSLAMINAGYDFIDDTLLDNIKRIISSYKYTKDSRIERLNREYEKTLKIWGYYINNYDIDTEEVIDLCKKISFYRSNKFNNRDFIYIKTVQRSLLIVRNIKSLDFSSYQRYTKYHKHFNYIISWINDMQ